MTAQIDKENSGLPRLQRTLNQLFDSNKQKLTKTSNYPTADTSGINATILLASRGIDAPKLTQSIESLRAPQAHMPRDSADFEPVSTIDRYFDLEQLKKTDLKSFLKSEKEACLMAVIEETKSRAVQEIEEGFSVSEELEWERQKQRIMQDLLGSFNPELAIANATTSTAMISRGLNTSLQGRTVMSDVELAFAREIYVHNQKVVGGEQSDLMRSFVALTRRLNDKNVEEMWTMLQFMCEGSGSGEGG